MKKGLSLFNLFSVLLAITVNYASQVTRWNNTTIGEISDGYNNLFTPAGYAFAIWGPIFLGLLAYGIFQVYRAFLSTKNSTFIERTGYWFAIANLLNAAWVIAFVYDHTGLSVLIMLGILFSLVKIILNTNMERWDAPITIIAFVWWPICLYSGWISVATIANIAAYLTKIEWGGASISETNWTMAMVAVATAIHLLILWKRAMREFAAVGAWAFFAIYIRHQDTMEPIAYTALAASVLLLMNIAVHGFINRKTNPFVKLRQKIKG